MQNTPYPASPPPIQRELDRIAAVLEITGVDVTGTNISAADEMADIRWEAGDGSRWMAVVSRFDPALWAEWAEGSQPPGGAVMSRQDESARRDRIAGVLTGQGCGDVLGAPWEYRTPPNLGTAVFGKAHGTYGHGPGEFTDDTQQAVIVAQSRSDPLKVARGLIAWHHGHPQDEGILIGTVLSRARAPADLATVSREAGQHRPPGSVSNGSLMRTGPVCLPHLGNRRRIAQAAREISDLTHWDRYAGDACVFWSLLVDAAIAHGPGFVLGSEIARALAAVPAQRRGWWEDRCLNAIASAPSAYKANGKAVDAFSAALSAVAHSASLEDGLHIAVSIGGDTYTIAAIAGALLGAIHGASAVPRIWRQRLHGWPGLDATGLEALALEAAGITG